VLETPPGLAIDDDNTDDMQSITAPQKSRAPLVGDAFRALLRRTERRVAGGTRSPSTLAMQREHVRYLIEHIGSKTPLADMTTRRIASVLEAEGRGRRRQLSGSTLRKRASTLSQALELARGRAPKLPEIPFDYQPRAAYLPHFDAYARLRDELPAERRLWLVVALWTGQRRSDVERMVREDFDPDAKLVVVRSWKTRRFAGIRIHAAGELVRELRAHWEQLAPGAKLVPAWPHANTWLRRRCDRLGLERITTHSLRHTFFTWYVAANGFTAELLEIGGWKDLTIPAKVYAHALPVRFRGQIDRTVAMAMSLRRGPRKSLAKAKAGTQSAAHGEQRIGAGAAETAPAPVTSPEGLRPGTGLNRRSPDLLSQAVGRPVGPAGFEPAAYGLKVRNSAVSVRMSLVGKPTEGHPCLTQQPRSRAP
jgi:integrase